MKALWVRSLWLLLAAVVFFGAIGLVAIWAPDEPVDGLKSRWAKPPSRFIEVFGQQVHVRDEGPHDDPAPIVLLHGTSSSLHTWQGWAMALREQRRVIRIDLPGFGLTGPRRDFDYSTNADMRFVNAVLQKLEVHRFVLAGNSLGGQIAWTIAARMPDRVVKLILVDAAGYPPSSMNTQPQLPVGFRLVRMTWMRQLVNFTMPRGLIESSLHDLYGDPAKVTPELVDLYFDMTLRHGNREALAHRIDQRVPADLSLLKKIKAPTLVIWGGKDRVQPVEVAERFQRDIAGAKLVVFDKLGHMPQEEDPERTVAEVRRFLGF